MSSPQVEVRILEHSQPTIIPGLKRTGCQVMVLFHGQATGEKVFTTATVWDRGRLIPLPIPFYQERCAQAINNTARVAGVCDGFLSTGRALRTIRESARAANRFFDEVE